MSKYLMNKLIHLINMDEHAEKAYAGDPRRFVEEWEKTQKLKLDPEEREALATAGAVDHLLHQLLDPEFKGWWVKSLESLAADQSRPRPHERR